MEVLKWVGFGSFGLVLVAWILVSFLAESRVRTVLEWVGATAGFAALSSFFVSLFLRAWDAGSLPGMVGFGLFCFIFLTGLMVSTVKTALELAGRVESGGSATN